MTRALGLLAIFAALQGPAGLAETAIIPRPAQQKELDGAWSLQSNAVISYAGEEARVAAEQLAGMLRPATGFPLPVQSGAGGDIVLRLVSDPGLGREGYQLRIADRVSISAPAAAGLFYGAQTLRQLLPPEIYSPTLQQKPWVAPRIEICDRPEFRWRGLHLDVSRHFMPKEDIFRFLDVMASLKLNTFHWHLTDDQGWRIEIKKYPKLTDVGAWRDRTLIGHARDKVQQYDNQRYGGFYTQEDVREVVAYAAARQIMVVPEIDMPGHMQAAVAAYPELGCTADPVPVKTEWGVSANILNPEESTVEFCKNVLTEIIDLFPSEYIHIGGDEADKSKWKQSPRIQQLMKERGLADMHQMQSWFIRQIDDFLTAKGRRLIGWDEIADGGLARNGTLMWWRKAAGKTAEAAAQGGQDVVIAVTEYLYFDFYYSAERENEPLAIGGNLPLQKVYAFAPIPKQWSPAAASHVLGAQGQLWTEYIKDMRQVEYMAFPRACALSEAVWSPSEGKGYADFLRRIRVQEQRFSAAGVNFRREP